MQNTWYLLSSNLTGNIRKSVFYRKLSSLFVDYRKSGTECYKNKIKKTGVKVFALNFHRVLFQHALLMLDKNLTSALPLFSIALVVYTSPSNSNLTGLWAQVVGTTATNPSLGSCLNSVWWVILPFGNIVAAQNNYKKNLIVMDSIIYKIGWF